ncbi:MAG: hypothetical protein LUJ09_01560 [Firmicutes bacterium]|nr:hypothetical protein [Bacillota bacterium]
MNGITIFAPEGNAAVRFAAGDLSDRGINIADTPAEDVTHLLLPVPSFDRDGNIRGCGAPEPVLKALPKDVTVIGGGLGHPALKGRRQIDLLEDAQYLAENAAITADCAIRIAGSNLSTVFRGCPILVIGWGRIGKCLARQLAQMGTEVTVAARGESDRAMVQALGFRAEHTQALRFGLLRYRVIFNTVPAPVLSREQLRFCRSDCVLIDLASQPGIAGDTVIWARGLPGKDVPEASGHLIARCVLRRLAAREAAI